MMHVRTNYRAVPANPAKRREQFGHELVDAILSEDSVSMVRCLVEADEGLALNCLYSFRYPNLEDRFHHHHEYLYDARVLLGDELRNLNCLHMALVGGDDELAEWLLHFLVDASVGNGDPRVLLLFLAATCGGGNTPLHLAAFFGMADVVRRLLELGANPNTRNALKYRPVDCADSTETRSLFQNLSMLDHHPLLLSMDHLVLRQTLSEVLEPKQAPWHLPAMPSKLGGITRLTLDLPISALSTPELITRSCASSPSSIDSDVRPPLVSCFGSDKAARRRWLAGRRVQFDTCTLLVHATMTGDAHLARSALEPYLDLPCSKRNLVEFRSPRRHATYLHLAANNRHPHMLRFWLAHGIDINSPDKDGLTPLHVACAEGDLASVAVLVENDSIVLDAIANDRRAPWDMTDSSAVLSLLHTAYLCHPAYQSQITSTAPTPAVSPRISKDPRYSSATVRHRRPPPSTYSSATVKLRPTRFNA
ncbi:hypothetical protein DSO57_1025451 [Entomophthora muscae]|uniref:Uncharacterized protein n=1 Tax=Entomophthora muscae TaxID=34485 RepID=A0ACC2UBU5_9FUNG|nr:hypothetical protein DSO57_1025451 [Entomophthora muscae]